MDRGLVALRRNARCYRVARTFYNNNDTSLLGSIPNGINNNGMDTPDRAVGILRINNNPRNGLPAFDTSLFSLPALGTFGTSARRFFSGPGILNFDMALQKNLRLTESKSLQFRVESFNTFNHAQFFGASSVDGNISSATFGKVVGSLPPRLVQLAAKFVFLSPHLGRCAWAIFFLGLLARWQSRFQNLPKLPDLELQMACIIYRTKLVWFQSVLSFNPSDRGNSMYVH